MVSKRLAVLARALFAPAAMAALYVVASLPFLPRAPTSSDDSLIHLYRLLEFDRCLRQGALLPRWAPDLVQGYGYPLFNFQPPLAYYVAEVWHLLGFSLVRSLNLTFVLSGMLAGAFMYLFVRDLAGQKGAVLAALLYMYAPFPLFSAYYRGGLAEVLAWGLAPMVLWSLRRLAATGRARWLVLAALSLAAIPLTHLLVAVMLAPLAALVVLGTWLERRSRQGLLLAALAILLAIGISSFVSAPAYLEKGAVRFDLATAGHLDFRAHFSGWQTLLAGPVRADVSLINRPAPRTVGWIQIALAIPATLGVALARPARRLAWYLGGVMVAGGLIVLMQRISLPIWNAFTFLGYLQFPWRLLAPLALVLAFVGGGIGLILPEEGRWAWAGTAAIAVVALGLFLYDTPLFYPRYQRLPGPNPTLADLLAYERDSSAVGLTTNGEYLPASVQELPPGSPMAAQYAASSPVTWLDGQSLPDGVRVQEASYGPGDMRFTFASQGPFRAVINQFCFPGWEARIDGSRVPITPVAPHGLIGVDLPAGTHRLQVHFGDTPLRQATGAVSLLSTAALVAATLAIHFRGRAAPSPLPAAGAAGALPAWGWALLFLVTAGYVAFKVVALDPGDSLFKIRRLDGDRLKGVQHARQVDLGHEMALLGYDLPDRSVAAGDYVTVRLYWKALRPMTTEYSVSVQIFDDQVRQWGEGGSWHPGGYPTARWEADTYDLDTHQVRVWPGTPPGEYTLRVTVYSPRDLRQLEAFLEGGASAGPSFVLDTIQVTRPARPPEPQTLGMARVAAAAVNGDLELLGYNLPAEPVLPGQRLGFTLFWRATRRPRTDYELVALLGDDATGGQGRMVSPVAGQPYPASAWQPGEIVRAQYDLLVPARAQPGANRLQIALRGPDGSLTPPVILGPCEVLPVVHRMEIPEMANEVGASLADQITLLGYDLSTRQVERGQALRLTLYWQAREETVQDYKVFTHLLDANDRISAQQDGVPVRGSRPTAGWVKGEVIADEYELLVRPDAPTGEHRIEVGFYEPATGRRLAVYDDQGRAQGDRVLLDSVEVR